jgi:hypothetical protein
VSVAGDRRSSLPWWALAFFVIGCVLLFLGTHALGTPRLDASGIHLRSLGVPLATISYAEIESVRAESFAGMLAGGNPLRTLRVSASCPNGVSIRTRSGWFNRILTCPDDPNAFVRQVEARRISRPSA